ncbi:MAG: D-alanyl-D-alanine carboxypeptidase/D-alanyl-D-alanine-endopeptidase [Burkholderiales bacterium]|jgi:D-alanyl-D-alanine carboxypeptidase/D-alanyl-D-alanine-endopeptidase (penicillin-binding protein 4)|nr:D-alanyl-D-alanine carboxypeptidase/D-alanyl-D-alanine-endopeptidase [Burkholderiales bacterium]
MLLRLLLAAFAVFLAGPIAAQELPAVVAQALAKAGIPQASVGAYVHGVNAAKPALAFNAAQPMNPASTIKLVTTYAALELLGPTFTWKTDAYIAGPLHDGVLTGDLVLKGSGDPKLTLENFWLLLRGLRQRGLKEIRGDLVLDRSAFDAGDWDPARFDGEPMRAYNVGPDALLVNFKAVRFLFVPEIEHGTARIVPEPKPAQLSVTNNVRLTSAPCGDWRANLRMDVQNGAAGPRVTFTGSMPSSCGERIWNVGLLSHSAYAGGVFRTLWEEMGGTLAGTVRDGPVPPNARLFATQESPPLTEIVRDINKFSNNVMARQLFLTLSAEALKLPGRGDRSARTVASWLSQKGLEFPELVMENGSGLSRIERISAASMGRMLVAAYQSSVMPELMSSMPLVAYDGTMRKRLKLESVAGQAHIKTGSLADVRSIAGYVLDRHGRRQAVVFFVNGPNAGAAQPAIDAFLRWVYDGTAPGA